MNKVIKSRSTKVGPEHSTYCLYVRFLPAYARTQAARNYYSNRRFNDNYELNALKRRVLHGSCAGKYSIAMLYHQPTGKCLTVWVPGQPEMSYEAYQEFKKKRSGFEKSYLTALVLCKKPFRDKMLREKNQRTPFYIYSRDRDALTGRKSYNHGLRSLLKDLKEGIWAGNYNLAIVYHGANKGEVARIDAHGRVTCRNKEFEKLLRK